MSKNTYNIQTKKNLEETELDKNIKNLSKLNQTNIYLSYIFYFFQISGILVTTISTSYNLKKYLWLGIGLNFTASSFFNVIERQNEIFHKNLLKKINLSRQKLIQYENIFINYKINSYIKNTDNKIDIKHINEDDLDYIKINNYINKEYEVINY